VGVKAELRFPGPLVCYLLVFVIAFLSYSDSLGYFFDGRDDLTLIKTGRVSSFDDVVRILATRTLKPYPAEYYRPLSVFSYGLDYHMWKLNPFGYQLTNLLLHSLISILVFSLARALARGDNFFALAAALIFTLHPILVEVVPCTERRPNLLSTFFFLLSLRFSVASGRRGRYFLSLLCYVLSLCSREAAVILLPLIWTYHSLFAEGGGRIVKGFKVSAPYFLVTAVYVLWRIVGPGATAYRSIDLLAMAKVWLSTVSQFFAYLFYPVDFISSLPAAASACVYALLACGVVTLFLSSWKKSFPLLRGRQPAARSAGLFLLALSVISMLLLVTFPFTGRFISHALRQAHGGESFQFIGRAMEFREIQPVKFYADIVSSLLLGTLFFSFFATWLGFLFVANLEGVRDVVEGSRRGKVAALCVSWLLAAFLFYLATVRFGPQYLYLPAVPFSMLVSLGISVSIRSLSLGVSPWKSAVCLVLCGLLVAPFAMYSPLFRSYRGWEGSSSVHSMFLNGLLAILPGIPPDATLHIKGLPSGIASYDEKTPHVKSVVYISEYSVLCWLILNGLEEQRRVVLEERKILPVPPRELSIRIEEESTPADVVMTVVATPAPDGR